MKTTRITQASLDELAYRLLREAILSPGGLAAGDHVDEKEFSERLGISRTPIREAVRRLEVEGLVKRAPRRGVFVADLSPEAIDELYNLREVLEGLAARLAADRASDAEIQKLRETYDRYAGAVRAHDVHKIFERDVDFHDLIARASRSERLQSTIKMFRNQLGLLRTRSVTIAGRSEKALEEMGRVLDAIVRRAADDAEEAMRRHIREAQRDMLSSLKASLTPAR
jgi:DNA-binding GntR family transcriptional regulator